jgi:hypothetical protein
MRAIITVTTVLLIFQVAQVAPCAEKKNVHPYVKKYVKDTYGLQAGATSGAGAAIQQIRDKPSEWGGGIAGFGKRLGSAFGQHVIKNTIEFGVASVRHEEIGYRPSGKTGFRARLQYALLSTVITHKTTTGEPTVALGRISGSFGSGLISRLWMPASYHTIASGFATGGIMLGVDAGTHVVREFWPEIRHPHRRTE